MKKNIKVVIGSNWGDEGKGLMVDYFCRQSKDRILNVRYNGGAQAGHTVVTEDSFRHIFSHFGAGSFNNNVDTYLTRDFIVNPILFWKEYKKLSKMGIKPKIYIHENCYITTPYDMMINCIIEEERGVNRHGSVGIGIFETVNRSKYHPLTIKYAKTNKKSVIDLVENIKTRWVKQRLNDLGVNNVSNDMMGYLNDEGIFTTWCEQLLDFLAMTDVCEIVDDTIMDKYKNIVFEGAQGLLLDQNNMDFWPNLTPSNTGMKNVIHALSNAKITEDADIDVCYVTRTYFTRHGAGNFPSECTKDEINPNMVDLTNKPNLYQGSLRYGYFDRDLFIKSLKKDISDCAPYDKKFNFKFGLVVTHFNETDYFIKMKDELLSLRDFASSIELELPEIEDIYASDGMTWRSIEKIQQNDNEYLAS